ncbi:ThiF family adenylyltransferase [Bacillaceae bacterium S4-13-58]
MKRLYFSDKLRSQRIAIIGLGGTGSYVLDLVAKTTVSEIYLFDGDEFLQHNAFRAPGAPTFKQLEIKENKAVYFASIYSNMKKNIHPHSEYVTSDNVQLLLDYDFVFICIDEGEFKKDIIPHLLEHKIPFIDVGMDVKNVDNSLLADVRTTTVTPTQSDHITQRISLTSSINYMYESNIQIAELNALNAALAVIKWKKQLGFYHDHRGEVNSIYSTNTGDISND